MEFVIRISCLVEVLIQVSSTPKFLRLNVFVGKLLLFNRPSCKYSLNFSKVLPQIVCLFRKRSHLLRRKYTNLSFESCKLSEKNFFLLFRHIYPVLSKQEKFQQKIREIKRLTIITISYRLHFLPLSIRIFLNAEIIERLFLIGEKFVSSRKGCP